VTASSSTEVTARRKAAAEAADELLNELYHQGGFVCSAAVAALPFVIEAAESARVACRGDVLEIVGRLARTSREVAALSR
jgi:hypothetical protein